MLARAFPVPEPGFKTPPGEPWCTYLVHYPGPAEDIGAWLAHYLANHTRIMATFPAIREIEVCSRIDWCGALPWPRVDHMQRNKVVFDDGAALKAAMTSSVMQDMRADFHTLPPFDGGNRPLSDGDGGDRLTGGPCGRTAAGDERAGYAQQGHGRLDDAARRPRREREQPQPTLPPSPDRCASRVIRFTTGRPAGAPMLQSCRHAQTSRRFWHGRVVR